MATPGPTAVESEQEGRQQKPSPAKKEKEAADSGSPKAKKGAVSGGDARDPELREYAPGDIAASLHGGNVDEGLAALFK